MKFEYDGAGNVIKRRVERPGVGDDTFYTFDAANRLTKAVVSGTPIEYFRKIGDSLWIIGFLGGVDDDW